MLIPSVQNQKAPRLDSTRRIRVGWISSWNIRCGIAEYSKFILDQLVPQKIDWTVLASHTDNLLAADDPRVIRCWFDSDGEITTLLDVIQKQKFDVVVLQFSFTFQSLDHVQAIIAVCNSVGTRIIMICHSTRGADSDGKIISITQVSQSLKGVDSILVHSINDIQELYASNLIDNVELFPHGYLDAHPPDRQAARSIHQLPQDATIIGSYGFMLPHKGIDRLVEAVAHLRDTGGAVKLLLINALYPNHVSDEQLAIVKRMIEELGLRENVLLRTDYLPNEVSLSLLAACDVLVFPYQKTEESSSAAVRMGIASRRPVLCTPLPIFSDVSSVVTMLPGCGADDICRGLQTFLSDTHDKSELAKRQADWVDQHAWSRVAALLQSKLVKMQENEFELSIGDWLGQYLGTLVDDRNMLRKQVSILQRTNEILQRTNESLVQTRDTLQHVNQVLEENERNARTELQLVFKSTSWRVTRPLRRLRTSLDASNAGIIGKLSGLGRRIRSHLPPASYHEKSGYAQLSRRQQAILRDLERSLTSSESD